jgi:hypothetical protein
MYRILPIEIIEFLKTNGITSKYIADSQYRTCSRYITSGSASDLNSSI